MLGAVLALADPSHTDHHLAAPSSHRDTVIADVADPAGLPGQDFEGGSRVWGDALGSGADENAGRLYYLPLIASGRS